MVWIFFDVMSPKRSGIMKSISPWHCRMGRTLWPVKACAKRHQVSDKTAQSLISEKLLKCIGGSELWKKCNHNNVKTASVPMGKSYEVVTSNWGPQHQLTDTGRSRRYTTTRPHPEKNKFNRGFLCCIFVQIQCWNTEMYPTWEKPPRIIRCGGIPFLVSCSIMALTRWKQADVP